MKTSWSRTFIVHNERKIYLENSYWDVKEKLSHKNVEVKLTVTGLFFNKEKTFMTNNITNYGRV